MPISDYRDFIAFKNESKVSINKEKCISIIYDLQKIFFLNYFEKCDNEEEYVLNKLTSVSNLLKEEIKNSLLVEGMTETETKSLASKLTFAFLNELPNVKELLVTDIEALYNGDPASCDKHEIALTYPGMFAIMVYRISNVLYRLNIKYIPRVLSEYAHSITGIDIHPGASIKDHFFIDHGTGIVIGETTIIGSNVKLYQGVTLGALSIKDAESLRNKKRHPEIKDNVTIYSGASILGGDTVIGENCIIGSNVFITSSVNKDTVVKSTKTKEDRFVKLNN